MQCSIRGWIVLGTLTLAPFAAKADDEPAGRSRDGGRPDPAALFDRLDANHDGKLTADECSDEHRALFDRLLKASDKDGNGSLSRDEFIAGMERRRPDRAPTEKSEGLRGQGGGGELAQMFARLDANRDGKVTVDEVPEQARERFNQLLLRADKNSDGVLTKDEIDALTSAPDAKREGRPGREGGEGLKFLFNHLDANSDHKITSDEVPEERREHFDKLKAHFDADGDGALSEEEFIKGMTAMRQMRGRGGDGKGPGGDSPGSASPGSASPGSASPGNASPGESPGSPGERKRGDRPGFGGGFGGRGPGAGMLERIKELDKNKDGKLSAEEFGDHKRFFEMLDANHDGFVDQDEIKAFDEKARKWMKKSDQ